MNFFKKLFGGGSKDGGATAVHQDKNGLYFYVRAHKCEAYVRVRADKQHDLEQVDGGYAWHKTIVDGKCFSRMQATVHLDRNYQIIEQQLEGGEFITAEEYDTAVAKQAAQRSAPAEEEEDTPPDPI